MTKSPWWHSATAYQVYPRSFCDSNGDGVGDIPGLISKLDYLADLGIGFIWLSPVYTSPMDDNGYDISNYRDIAPEFGTLDDFDRLVTEAKARGIGIVMDLVVNHTSDRHPWFQDARSARDAEKRDWYIWRDPGPDGGPPNGIQSFFGGPAWTFDEATGQYYFHLFVPGQPDLNWTNPEMRQAVYEMMNWWFDRGIAGFRMDVIDLIGKEPDRGITADGPKLHDHIREMHAAALAGRDVVTVGEAWSANTQNALRYSGRDSQELSMVFQFEHVSSAWDPVHGKWKSKPRDLVALKRVFFKWQKALEEDGWNSLFWSNHDLPRAVSKYGDDGEHREVSAKMLATVLHMMKGTPYVYQGEELGMTNMVFTDVSQFDDVEVRNNVAIQAALGMSEADFLKGANENARDHARTPMHWTDGENAGFTSGTPWLPVNPNHDAINAEAQVGDPQSVFQYYRHLIALRKQHPIIVAGGFVPLAEDHPEVFAYARELGGKRLTVVANFTARPVAFDLPDKARVAGHCLITNSGDRTSASGRIDLAPFEAFAILGAAD